MLLARTSFAFNNTQIALISHTNGTSTTLASRLLPFQFEAGSAYQVALQFNSDRSGTNRSVSVVVWPPPFGSVGSVLGPVKVADWQPGCCNGVFFSDIEGGVSYDTRQRGDFVLRFDNVEVRSGKCGSTGC